MPAIFLRFAFALFLDIIYHKYKLYNEHRTKQSDRQAF